METYRPIAEISILNVCANSASGDTSNDNNNNNNHFISIAVKPLVRYEGQQVHTSIFRWIINTGWAKKTGPFLKVYDSCI